MTRPSLFEFAGGESAFVALATAHHERCLADPVLNHAFSHPGHPRHVERLASYWAEVFGGPQRFSRECGGHSGMIGIHAGQGAHGDLGERFLACFVRAADDAKLPGDPEFRAALRSYMEWAVAEVMSYSPNDSRVPSGLAMPRWSWDGLSLPQPADMLIRDASAEDWPAIWSFMRTIAAAGETFTWDRDITEERARSIWLDNPHGRAFVAVDDAGGAVMGTAEVHRNQAGPGAHVANAGFMIDPAHSGRGVGRALGEHVLKQARADGFRCMQFNAVVETNVRAVKLWQSLGFDILTTVPEAFHHPTLGYVGLHVMFQRLQ